MTRVLLIFSKRLEGIRNCSFKVMPLHDYSMRQMYVIVSSLLKSDSFILENCEGMILMYAQMTNNSV